MTDVRLEDCAAPDDGWDGWDDWDTGLRRSVDRAEAARRQPGRVSGQTVETLPPAPSARPARRSDGPRPAPALLARLATRARTLGPAGMATAVLADLTWPARTLVPRHPATSAVAT